MSKIRAVDEISESTSKRLRSSARVPLTANNSVRRVLIKYPGAEGIDSAHTCACSRVRACVRAFVRTFHRRVHVSRLRLPCVFCCAQSIGQSASRVGLSCGRARVGLIFIIQFINASAHIARRKSAQISLQF